MDAWSDGHDDDHKIIKTTQKYKKKITLLSKTLHQLPHNHKPHFFSSRTNDHNLKVLFCLPSFTFTLYHLHSAKPCSDNSNCHLFESPSVEVPRRPSILLKKKKKITVLT